MRNYAKEIIASTIVSLVIVIALAAYSSNYRKNESFSTRTLVIFHYTPQCPHCKHALKEWYKVKQFFSDRKNIAFVENDENKKDFRFIDHVPAISMNNGYHNVVFGGLLTSKEIISWMRDNAIY